MTHKQMTIVRTNENNRLAFKAVELVDERGLRTDEMTIDLGTGDKYQITTGGAVAWDDLETILGDPADAHIMIKAATEETE